MPQVPALYEQPSTVILNQYGQPLRRELLAKEMASPLMSGVRNIQSGHPAQGLTPVRLARLLRQAEDGDWTSYCELAEEMEEKDLHYLSVIGTRKRCVSQLPIRVEPADGSAEARKDAELIERWLKRDTLQTELFNILDAVGKGVSFTEIIWEFGDVWQPKALKWRMPQWFEFDRVDGETPKLRDEAGQLIDLPYGKFIVHHHPAKSGLPVRGGLARAVAWGYMFKNYSIRDWVSFLELYGKPLRFGRYDIGAHEDDIRKLMRAVSQIGADATAVFPRTMDIEFESGSQGTSPKDMWGSLAGYIDDQVSKAVVGQTSSADAKAGGIGSGQADLHSDVRDDITNDDGGKVAATLNRDMVVPMVDLNHGRRKAYPRLIIEKPKPIDVKTRIESAEKLVEMGVEIPADQMRDEAGFSAPKSATDKLLIAPSKNAPETPLEDKLAGDLAKKPRPLLLDGSYGLKSGSRTGSKDAKSQPGDDLPEKRAAASANDRNAEPAAPDAIDDACDESLSDWEEHFDGVVDPLVEELQSLSSAEDVGPVLARYLSGLDTSQMQDFIARTGFAAAIAAELDVATEQKTA